MKRTAQDILNFVEDNDVKFAKLTFCDIFGNQKNVSLFASELPRAFAEGVSFDGSSIAGFMNVEESDLVLWPDPDTATVLPWRPTEGRVIRMYCDITLPNGKPFEGNCRGYLQSVVKRARAMGLTCNVGCECEFYLFETDENGNPTRIPLDMGGYFDIPPLDKGENIRREICFAIEEMRLHPEHSHHESGHGQNEVCFRYTTALKSADNLNTFKSTVKAIAARNGLFASFMPKPIANQPGSGLHVNMSLLRDGKNLFEGDLVPDSEAGHFVAGILAHARELTAFCNPVPNSYARLGANEAPLYVSWSRQNRSQLVRLPSAHGDLCRVELRGRPRRQPVSCHRPDSGRRAGRHPAPAAPAGSREPQPVPPQRSRRAGQPAPHPARGHHGGRPERVYQPRAARSAAKQVLRVPDPALPRRRVCPPTLRHGNVPIAFW